MSVRFEMRLPDEMAEAIDRARANEPRAAWIKRTLGAALGVGGPIESHSAPGSLPDGSASSPAPRRAPATRQAFTDASVQPKIDWSEFS